MMGVKRWLDSVLADVRGIHAAAGLSIAHPPLAWHTRGRHHEELQLARFPVMLPRL